MENWLTTGDVARILGIKEATLRTYRVRYGPGGQYEGHPFPAADERVGNSLFWRADREDELLTWAATRPGKGVGGGRPARKAERPTVSDRAQDDGSSAG